MLSRSIVVVHGNSFSKWEEDRRGAFLLDSLVSVACHLQEEREDSRRHFRLKLHRFHSNGFPGCLPRLQKFKSVALREKLLNIIHITSIGDLEKKEVRNQNTCFEIFRRNTLLAFAHSGHFRKVFASFFVEMHFVFFVFSLYPLKVTLVDCAVKCMHVSLECLTSYTQA